jgi:RHS repeat-associated protein
VIRAHRYVVLMLTLAFCTAIASGQVPTGTPPFGSYGGGPDTINLANLNSHIAIPVLHKPGRGTDFTYDLGYDSSVWFPTAGSWQSVSNWSWRGMTEPATGYVTAKMHTQYCPNPNPGPPATVRSYYYDTFVYHDTFGSSHPFNLTVQSAICSGGGESGLATDASGYTITFDISGDGSFTLTSRSGAIILTPPLNNRAGAGTFTDRNGNQISVSSTGVFTDTLGKTPLSVSGTGTPSSPTVFTYTAPSGSPAYKMIYTAYTVQTKFGCNGIAEYGPIVNNLVSEIDLPDTSKYTFTYEATPGVPGNVTGRLASVTLPTGGTISYGYTGGSSGINCADGSAATLTRTTPDGTWTYAQVKGTGAASTTTVTDPQGNNTIIQFQGIYETQRQTYQLISGTQTLIQTRNICYNYNAIPCTGTSFTLPISHREVDTDIPDANGLRAHHAENLNSFGLPTWIDDYDYGVASYGPLLKRTLIAYASLGNINAFKQTITICNGAGSSSTCNGMGTVISQTTNTYDEHTPTPTSGTPQHVAVTGSRGNLTSSSQLVQGSTSLTSHFTYYDTGTLSTTTDANSAVTTYNYDVNSSCGFGFPTSVKITQPITMTSSMAWNCTGGLKTSSTDVNGNVTSATYTDPFFWRPASTTDPTNAVTSICYGILSGGNCSVNFTQVESALTFSSSTVDTLVTRDSLGRPGLNQRRQSPGSPNFDSILQWFDSNGRPAHLTVPYQGTAGQSCCGAPSSSATYDPLNRPLQSTDAGGGTVAYVYSKNDVSITVGPVPSGENAKSRQLEYDALGRLTSVCEITSVSGSGTCGQKSPQTGFWTTYTYDPLGNLLSVTQNAQAATGSQQTRTYSYDGLSRLTSETNPESGATSYTYDTDSYCGTTSSGDLVKRVDANGNTNCYYRDALHRTVSVLHYGPNALYGHNFFVYDSAVVNGQTMQNGKGRLVEAFVSGCQTCSKITDTGFSYTARGEVSDLYASTPHSGGYYHSALTYWANGSPNVLTGMAGYYASYNVDSEGRPYQVLPSSGQAMVTNTTYNAASLPTGVTYGSGDSDSFTYDPQTNRMTQYKFTVNSSSLTGTLGWNANGTLQTQNITDPFNSANTQNCSYGYDDLTRLTSANCGAAASQTFSYNADGSGAFGNINKSGSPYSFTPNYSSATNRMTTINGFTPSYDNNGNVLNDNSHTYSWDSEGRPATIDSVNLTYDALGRMVEQSRNGTYTQFVYAPTGQKIQIMNGQAPTKDMVALPGGGLTVYTSGQYYYHSDHLGSFRFASTSNRTMYFDLAYAPFGETYASSGSTEPAFTSQRQDTVAGIYDFPAREYNIQGRWASPDPAGRSAVSLSNPQTWNRYAYLTNNPLGLIDPSGLGPTGGPTCLLDELGNCHGGGGGGGGSCTIDGFAADCGVASSLLQSGAGVQCPNNYCGIGTSTPYQCAGSVCGYMSNQYVATHENEYNGILYSDSQWHVFLSDRADAQRQALADAISYASSNPDGSNWDYIYDNLSPYKPGTEDLNIQGGNVDFSWTGNNSNTSFVPLLDWNKGGCPLCRYGSMDAIHFNHDMFHLDTASPAWGFGLGLFMHGFVDVLLGNINPGVPIGR